MNARFLIPIIAGTFFTLSAQAHDCSGGTDGGMDATGNQCNDAATFTTDASSSRPTSLSARAPKTEANKAPSGNKSAVKPTTVTRHVPAPSQIKQS
jgi:hypothetical protein